MSPRALVAHPHKFFKPWWGEGRGWEVFQLIGLTLDHVPLFVYLEDLGKPQKNSSAVNINLISVQA